MSYKLKTVLDDELDRNIKAQEEQKQQQTQEKPTVNTTVSSTVPATQTNNPTPVKSAAVDQAYALLQQQQTNNLSKWQDAADAYLSRYENRDPFVYNMNADALYNQYKDMYVNQGQLASMDVMGQAAALTGGYGNSYAQSVGHQAYNQYLGQLNTIVPELYQQAYDRYAQEGQNLLNMYDIYTNRENQEYARDWEKQMFEYQKERDKVADEQWLKSFNRSSSGSGSGKYKDINVGDTVYKTIANEVDDATTLAQLQDIVQKYISLGYNKDQINALTSGKANELMNGGGSNKLMDIANNVGDFIGILFGR